MLQPAKTGTFRTIPHPTTFSTLYRWSSKSYRRSRCQVHQGNVESPRSSTECSHQSMDRWYPYVYIQAHTHSSQEFQRNRRTFTEKKSRRRYRARRSDKDSDDDLDDFNKDIKEWYSESSDLIRRSGQDFSHLETFNHSAG